MSTESAPSQLTVAIAPLGSISHKQALFTAGVLETEFSVKTILLPAMEPPTESFNVERNRYKGHEILDFLFPQLPVEAQRIIGIIEGALEYNSDEPCQGLAYPYHRASLYRIPRLSTQQPNQIKSEYDQYTLSYHLIVHEFGHTLGLNHCKLSDCAMNSERYGVLLCAHCRRWANRELKVKPGSAEERFSFAESLLVQKQFTQAVAVYREAILCAPDEPLYHNRLANALNMVEQKDEASQEFDKSVKLSNDNFYYYTFGILELNTNQLERAKEDFANAVAKAKDKKLIYRLIGQAYREIAHDVEPASQHYKEYLRLGGDDPDVISWLISRNQMDQP
jgi:archaemetzincin